jgi:thymidylate kinase
MPLRTLSTRTAFFARVAAAYEQQAEAAPGRVRAVDASGSPDAVLDALADLLP